MVRQATWWWWLLFTTFGAFSTIVFFYLVVVLPLELTFLQGILHSNIYRWLEQNNQRQSHSLPMKELWSSQGVWNAYPAVYNNNFAVMCNHHEWNICKNLIICSYMYLNGCCTADWKETVMFTMKPLLGLLSKETKILSQRSPTVHALFFQKSNLRRTVTNNLNSYETSFNNLLLYHMQD